MARGGKAQIDGCVGAFTDAFNRDALSALPFIGDVDRLTHIVCWAIGVCFTGGPAEQTFVDVFNASVKRLQGGAVAVCVAWEAEVREIRDAHEAYILASSINGSASPIFRALIDTMLRADVFPHVQGTNARLAIVVFFAEFPETSASSSTVVWRQVFRRFEVGWKVCGGREFVRDVDRLKTILRSVYAEICIGASARD